MIQETTRKDAWGDTKQMQKFFCDCCKEEMADHLTTVLVYKNYMKLDSYNQWDLCQKCLSKIKELLGSGRSITAR